MPLLGDWAGYRLDRWRREARGGATWLVLSLLPDSRRRRRCRGCGKWVVAIHDQTLRRIRDLPVFDEPAELEV
jgi:transposase